MIAGDMRDSDSKHVIASFRGSHRQPTPLSSVRYD
jgi:hypothetical protein